MARVYSIFFAILCLFCSSPSFAQEKNPTLIMRVFHSEDMIFRADNIPKNLGGSAGSMSFSKGFFEDGNYGMPALEKLEKKLEKEITSRLEKSGWSIVNSLEENPDYVLQVLILDAKNNRPTHNQLSHSLDDGLKVGGASLVAKFTLVSDVSKFKAFSFNWYDRGQNNLTWGGAHQAFLKFSKKLSKKLDHKNLSLDGKTIKL